MLPLFYDLGLFSFTDASESLSVIDEVTITAASEADLLAMFATDKVETFLGNDKFWTELDLSVTGDADSDAVGLMLDNAELLTSSGQDRIEMTVSLTCDVATASPEVFGIRLVGDSRIDLGASNDFIRSEAKATGVGSTTVLAVGINLGDDAVLGTGRSSDVVRAIATAVADENPVAIGFRGGTLSYGQGRDKMHAWGSAEGDQGLAAAYYDLDIVGASGWDHACGTATAVGDGSTAFGFRGGSFFGDTYTDEFILTAIATGDAVAAYGVSDAIARMGSGNDHVEVSATIDGTGQGIGVIDSEFRLAGGNDKVSVSASTYGVDNCSFFGGNGRDVFELQSIRSGLVNGGGSQDRLVLDGESGDFIFDLDSATKRSGTVSLGEDGAFDVVSIELFDFADGQFTFEQLFVG